MSVTFLTKEEIAMLTGRKIKSLQIKQLQKKGLPFFINAVNEPIVTRVTIEGKKTTPEPPRVPWMPNVLKNSTEFRIGSRHTALVDRRGVMPFAIHCESMRPASPIGSLATYRPSVGS